MGKDRRIWQTNQNMAANNFSDASTIGGKIISEVSKGVGGRGLATNSAQNTAKFSPIIVFSYSSGSIGKRVQNKGRNLWYWRDFLAPTPSVRQPHFETSDYYILFLCWGIIFGNCYRKLYSIIFLVKFIDVM